MNLKFDKGNWHKVKFGDVAIPQKRNVDRDKTDLTKYVKGEHMSTEDIHLRDWGELKDEYLGPAFIRQFEKGDILYGSRRTYLKKVTIAPFSGITSNTTFVIKANQEIIDSRLLPFLMLSDSFTDHSIKNSKGSVNPYINWKDLANYQFLLPPKEEQAKIAELLWALDDLVENKKTILNILENTKGAIQRKYFDKTSSNLYEIEKLAKVYSGGTPDRKNSSYWNGNIPWIKTSEVNYNIITKTEEYISELGLKKSASKLIPKGSILVAMYGQGITRGRVAITGIEATCNQACGVIETKNGSISMHIFNYLEYKYEELRSLAHGANQQNLNLGMIKNFKVPIPNQNIIELSIKQFDQLRISKKQLESHIASSKILQKGLINKLF